MNDSRHFPAGLCNIPNLGVVWNPYEKKKKKKHNNQYGPGHCARYQYNTSIKTLGVASDKSVKISPSS